MSKESISRIICIFLGHAWAGGSFHILNDGGVDVRFCGRCCCERSFVD